MDENVKITKAVSAFDVGTPVNIQSVEGQIEGGMVTGIGYGVTIARNKSLSGKTVSRVSIGNIPAKQVM